MAIFADDYIRRASPASLSIHCGAIISRMACASCGANDEWRINGNKPPAEIIPRHFANKGWNLHRRPVCPSCQAKKKEKPIMIKPKLESVPTFDAKAARREAHDLIAMTFNIPTGQYNDGYSDERIAKETGIGVDWVKQRREDEFGPLKEPDELTAMRKQLAEAAAKVESIKSQFDQLCAAKGWAA